MSLTDEWSILSTRRRMHTVVLAMGAMLAIGAAGVGMWVLSGRGADRSATEVALMPAGAADGAGVDGAAVDTADEDSVTGSDRPAEGGSGQPDPIALVVSADQDGEASADPDDSDGTTSTTSGAGTTAGADQPSPSASSSSAPGSSTGTATTATPSTATTTGGSGGSSSSATTVGATTTTGGATTSTSTPSSPTTRTSTTAAPGTSTPGTSTPGTSVPSTQAPPSGGSGYQTCRAPSGGSTRSTDFNALRLSGTAASQLNQSGSLLRTVFELGSDRMSWGSEGLQLRVDMSDPAATNNRYRAELRESVIDQPIPVGSTQAYCMRFRADELPDLYGPVHIFQRFNRDNDGPDIGVELTGANQFSNAVPNDIQVVAWDGRNRIGAKLATVNTLMVVVHNHATNGSYKVVLNGRVLRERSGLNTVGAAAGGWSQFGIYPHGLYDDDGSNRQDQIDSGRTTIRFQYRDFTLTDFSSGPSDLSGFRTG